MSPSSLSRTVTVRNSDGLHLRPANLLVEIANQFDCELWLSHHAGQGVADRVDCRSILSLVTLGASDGTQLNLSATGGDAEAAVDAIVQFFDSGFDCEDDPSDHDSSDRNRSDDGSSANNSETNCSVSQSGDAVCKDAASDRVCDQKQSEIGVGNEANPTTTEQI